MKKIFATMCLLVMLSLIFVPSVLSITLEPLATGDEHLLYKDESLMIGSKELRINNVNEIGDSERVGVTIAVIEGEEYNYKTLFLDETKVIGELKITINRLYLDEFGGAGSWVIFVVENEEEFEVVVEEPVAEEPEMELEPVCWTTNYLLEGEENSYRVGEHIYDVFLTYVYHDDVKFTVNGENTPKLSERESYSLTDGVELGIHQITYQDFAGGVKSASFCFNAKAGVVAEPEPVEEELTCGDSYGGDGYYSACVGDVVKHDTGIKFEVVSFTEDGLKIKVINTGMFLGFDGLTEIVKFRYGGNTYKVEYNHYNPGRVTIFVSHSITAEPVEEEHSSDELVIIDREYSRVTEEVFVPDTECGTCEKDGNCLPFGTRLLEDGKPVYCGINGKLNPQESLGKTCQNNYECSSNQCSNGQCIDLSGQLEETQNILEKILFWFKKLFS